jgi:site-specific DNA-methyltransferase (cytosine-N4-specific)
MMDLLENGYKPNLRPSGHDISDQFQNDNGAAIPPNLLAIANTESNSPYLRYCRANELKPHPARFPQELPEFFVRMLTDETDLVLDPFAGSCVTGEVCERLRRNWLCAELQESYLKGAFGRFPTEQPTANGNGHRKSKGKIPGSRENDYFKLPRVGLLWKERTTDKLPKDGGKARPASVNTAKKPKKPKKKVARAGSKPRSKRAVQTS